MSTPTRPRASARTGATIYQVADAAGVSIATVSRVLRGSAKVAPASRERVTTAIDTLGYVPLAAAQGLASRSLEAHGLLVPELSGPYYADLVMGFEARAAELGQAVTVLGVEGRTDFEGVARALAGRVDGVAVLSSSAIPDAVVRGLARMRPVVVVGAGAPFDGVETFGTDNAVSARALTAHVLDHGRRSLRFVGDPALGADVRGRFDGFAAAHHDAGLPVPTPIEASPRETAGRQVARALLSRNELGGIDALVCANDELALAITHTLANAGVDVPHDLAVTGWDDVLAARYVRPGLTTVRQPVHEMGALAAQRLHDLVGGATPATSLTTLPTEIVIRGSCGCEERL